MGMREEGKVYGVRTAHELDIRHDFSPGEGDDFDGDAGPPVSTEQCRVLAGVSHEDEFVGGLG